MAKKKKKKKWKKRKQKIGKKKIRQKKNTEKREKWEMHIVGTGILWEIIKNVENEKFTL